MTRTSCWLMWQVQKHLSPPCSFDASACLSCFSHVLPCNPFFPLFSFCLRASDRWVDILTAWFWQISGVDKLICLGYILWHEDKWINGKHVGLFKTLHYNTIQKSMANIYEWGSLSLPTTPDSCCTTNITITKTNSVNSCMGDFNGPKAG